MASLHLYRALIKQQKGFTLIELMIVVALIALLSSIAYPSYNRYVQRSARITTWTDMQTEAQLLERNRLFSGAVFPTANDVAVPSDNGTYNITRTSTANTFTITATARGNAICPTLTLNEAGVMTDGSLTQAGSRQECLPIGN